MATLPVPGPGRDSSYRAEYAEQARKLCLLGYIDRELASFFGVSETTINNWKARFPAFLASIRAGKEAADAEVADSLYRRATGESIIIEKALKDSQGNYQKIALKQFVPGDVQAQRLWLLNRRKESWRDKQEHALTGADGAPFPGIEIRLVQPVNAASGLQATGDEK